MGFYFQTRRIKEKEKKMIFYSEVLEKTIYINESVGC
jgi:hypothetical protein